MGYSRDKLEENRKKKKALEQAFKQSNFQQTTQNLKTAAESIKPKTNTTTQMAAKSSGSTARTNTVTQSAPKQQSGLSSFQKLGNVAKTVQSVGTSVLQKTNPVAADRYNLQKNMIEWHGTTDTAKRNSLKQQNDAIRQRLGLSFDPSTGVTFDSKTGQNYSLPTQMALGQNKGQKARMASEYSQSREFMGKDAKDIAVQPTYEQILTYGADNARAINAHQVMADLYSRAAETWSEEDRSQQQLAKTVLKNEMERILGQFGLNYSESGLGASASWGMPNTVSDQTAVERLREAGADDDLLAYIAENIELRGRTNRIKQGLEAVGKQAVGAFPALVETSDQRRENLEQSRENPEYVKLEQEQQRLNAQLQEMQKKGQDVSSVVEYMKVYNELQEVIKQKDALAVKTPVDQNKWGQTMLREAAEAQANATAGLAAVPRFLADTGISIAGNAPTMALSAIPGAGPVAGMALMGVNAAGQRAAELNAQGVSPDEALGRGLTSGIIEAVTEKLPLDEMAKLLKGGGTSAVRNILRQMGIEASEESASYLMNYAADLAANDPNAEFSFAELAQSALGGAVSGGVFGTAGTVIGGTRTRQGPTVGIPESISTQEVDAGARMAQEAIQTAQGETLLPRTEIIQEGSSPRGMESNPYMGMPVQMLQNRLGQMQTRYWGADAETQQAMLEDMSRLSEAIESADQQAANSQALGRRLAELDAEKRQAETILPGPIRERAIQQAEEAMQRVQQEAAAKNPAPPARTEPSVQVPADAAFQYGLSPEAAMLEAQERARNEAIKAAQQSSVGAAEYNFDPFSRMTNEYGTIDQGEKPRAREVDVPKSTDGDDRVSLFARTAMEAGATPDKAIERFEQEVANGTFSHDVRKDKESVNKARKTITEKGFNGAMDQWADVTSGRRSATKDDIVLAEILYAEAMQAGDIDMGMRLAAEIAAEGTRAGQSIQAIRLLKRTTSEGKLYYIKKTVDNVQRDLNKKYGDKAPQIEINEQLALDLLAAKTDQDAKTAMDAIYTDVAAKIPATLGDRLNAWRYFAMLGNPRTHIRNVIGNIVYQIPTRASNKLSAGLQKLFIKDKDRRTRSLLRSGKIKEFAKQDYQTMQDVLDGNQYTSEMSEIQRRKKSFPKPIQAVMDANSKALDWEDQIFKRMTYVNSMTEFLTARRVDVDNIPQDTLEQARTHAIKDAQRATFQDASALADFIGKIEKKNKASEIIIGGLVPFKRTPINIAKRGFELSPAGLLKGLTYDLVQVKKGNMTATDAIDHISTGLTGTSLAALGAFLASQGLLSASSPENDKERNFDVAQGSQEYALNIGPYSYTIDWAAPAALPMFVGAEFYNAIAERGGDEEQAFKQATDALSRLFEPMINMTMLSGISGTLQSVGYSQTNPIFAIAENIGENYAGQFVPTLLGQVARTFDGTRRTTYADKDSWVPDSLQTFLQRQANKIPGLSKNQPAYTDVWGREERSDNVVLRAFENFISPGYISEQVSTDAEKALRDLYDATGEAAILPSKPQKYYKKDGKNVYLNAEQYAKLTGEKGALALDAINALVQSSAYQSMTNDERVSAIKDIYDYSSALAANKVYGKELEGTIKTVQESGIEPGLYYAYKELQDTLSETYESYEARDEVFQTIRSDDSLTDQQKNQLYHTLLIKGTSESQWEKYTKISGTVTAEEYIDAMIQSQAIKAYGDELDEDRATTEATEFSRYLDMKQYDSAKRAALEDTFKFYNMFPAEPQNYTFEMLSKNGSKNEQENVAAIQNSGVTAAQYLTIKTLAGEAEYEKGVSGAKLAAQAAIVAQNTQNYDQYAAIMHALGYKKIEDAYTGAGTLPAVTESGSQVSRQVESAAGFINPTTASRSKIVSWYGNREQPDTIYGKGSKFHEGVDIGGPDGQNLDGEIANSIGDGTVVDVGNDQYGYGNYVVVDYGNGYQALYGHLRQASVSAGQKVKAGEEIGIIGGTGNVEGPHLHLKMTKDGQNIDPLTVIPGYGTERPATTTSTGQSYAASSSGGGKSSGSSSKSTSNSLKKLKTPKQSWGGLDSLF
ncbi:peptidoglycan DD-metalloendopeptidase family protein [Agathobaculum sp. Marseille-P7918]|uniref:M23 family metallopeptidase n=1 Tax=Agathobaculum sp. Marseille-P7918 TaxID=2479843 RepID=UPI003568EF88